MKFRPQRSSLDESLKESIQFSSVKELKQILILKYKDTFDSHLQFKCNYCGKDERIGWDTHLITINGYAVGYTDIYVNLR